MKKIDDATSTIGGINSLVNDSNLRILDISMDMKRQDEINGNFNNETSVINQISKIVRVAIQEQKQALGEIV